jgi:hypothetical protein
MEPDIAAKAASQADAMAAVSAMAESAMMPNSMRPSSETVVTLSPVGSAIIETG